MVHSGEVVSKRESSPFLYVEITIMFDSLKGLLFFYPNNLCWLSWSFTHDIMVFVIFNQAQIHIKYVESVIFLNNHNPSWNS